MLLTISAFILILLVLYYLFNRIKKCYSNYLIVFYAILLVYALAHYYIEVNPEPIAIKFLYLHFSPVFITLGVWVYFYVNSNLTEKNVLNNKLQYLHFIPALIQFVAIANYYVLPSATKDQVVSYILNNPYNYFKLSIPGVYFNGHEAYFARTFLLFSYSCVSAYQLLKYKFSKKFVSQREGYCGVYNFKFLLLFVGTNLIFSSSHMFSILYHVIEDQILLYITPVPRNIVFGSLTILTTSLLFFPNVLYGLFPNEKKYVHFKKRNTKKEDETSDKVVQHAEMVLAYLENEKPYLNPLFSKSDLSMELHLTNQELSEVFDKVINEKFTDYKNRLRVEYAKNMITEGNSSKMSMEGIGKSSGFAYRSTFYFLFKKETGYTPLEYYLKFVEKEKK